MKFVVHIIGAGPYGISLANVLSYYGIPFRISGKAFDLWLNHTLDSMAIRSDRHASEIYHPENKFSLSGFIRNRYPDKAEEILSDRLPVDVFRAYLKDILSRIDFEISEYDIISLSRTAEGYRAENSQGDIIESSCVVLATGIGPHKYLPPSLKVYENSQRLIHTWDVQNYQDWNDKKILVVGAGQSAAEAIALLRTGNRITWISRHEPVFYSEPINLPRPVFNFFLKVSSLFYHIPTALRRILSRKFIGSTITPDLAGNIMERDVEKWIDDIDLLHPVITEDGVIVRRDGVEREFDAVISCTGFRYNMNSLGFLSEDIRRDFMDAEAVKPVLNRNFETRIKGLFLIGGMTEHQFGPAQRFIMGNSFTANRLGRFLSGKKEVPSGSVSPV